MNTPQRLDNLKEYAESLRSTKGGAAVLGFDRQAALLATMYAEVNAEIGKLMRQLDREALL